MGMRPAARMNERHGLRLWVKVVLIVVLIVVAFIIGRCSAHITITYGNGNGDSCGIVCVQSRLEGANQ